MRKMRHCMWAQAQSQAQPGPSGSQPGSQPGQAAPEDSQPSSDASSASSQQSQANMDYLKNIGEGVAAMLSPLGKTKRKAPYNSFIIINPLFEID